MSRNFVCVECGGHMEMGIIVDNAIIANDASYWMEGTNERSWTGFLKDRWKKKKHYISALRCKTYGFLKFYAGPENSKENK
jgi:hypothetical protein